MNESFESAEHLAAVAIAEQTVRATKAKAYNPFESWPEADGKIRCTSCGQRGACRIKSAGVDRKHRRATMVLQELQCECGYIFTNCVALERRR